MLGNVIRIAYRGASHRYDTDTGDFRPDARPYLGRAAEVWPKYLKAAGREPSAPRIIRVRRYAVKPMSIEDAAAEIGDGRDAVIVFRNSTSDTVTVLFHRPDGNFGLIEPEA